MDASISIDGKLVVVARIKNVDPSTGEVLIELAGNGREVCAGRFSDLVSAVEPTQSPPTVFIDAVGPLGAEGERGFVDDVGPVGAVGPVGTSARSAMKGK